MLTRAVIDVEADAEGRLRPRAGATIRSEPARGEQSIHRRLARLAEAPTAAIVTFASVHGPLRRTPHPIQGEPRQATAAALAVVGQQASDDTERARLWFESGAVGSPPPGTEDAVATVILYAQLPTWIHDAFDRYRAGEEADAGAGPDFFAVALRSANVAIPSARAYVAEPGAIRALDRAAVRRAFALSEWMTRVLGRLEEEPESIVDVGGADAFMRQLIAMLPAAFPVDDAGPRFAPDMLIGETADDWRAAAIELAALVRLLELVRAALGTRGVSPEWKRELLAAYEEAAGFRPIADCTAAELANRLRPLLGDRLEAELAALGAWPVRQGALLGLYARALVAAWTELTDSRPPRSCATPGCPNLVPATRNRKYCEDCLRRRKAAGVRAIRGRGSGGT